MNTFLKIFLVASTKPNVQEKAPEPNQELVSRLFEDIEPMTSKIGLGFFEQYWYVFLLLGIVVLLSLYFIFKPKKLPKLTAFEKAILGFDKVQNSVNEYDAKEYAQLLSQIVRDYIEEEKNIPAPELTTQEFLKIASNSELFETQEKLNLEQILKLADMAKFAKLTFDNKQKQELFDLSKSFVLDDENKKQEKELGK